MISVCVSLTAIKSITCTYSTMLVLQKIALKKEASRLKMFDVSGAWSLSVKKNILRIFDDTSKDFVS